MLLLLSVELLSEVVWVVLGWLLMFFGVNLVLRSSVFAYVFWILKGDLFFLFLTGIQFSDFADVAMLRSRSWGCELALWLS